jgi:hypothetical protein
VQGVIAMCTLEFEFAPTLLPGGHTENSSLKTKEDVEPTYTIIQSSATWLGKAPSCRQWGVLAQPTN